MFALLLVTATIKIKAVRGEIVSRNGIVVTALVVCRVRAWHLKCMAGVARKYRAEEKALMTGNGARRDSFLYLSGQ